MRKYASVGIAVPDILLPGKDIDYSKWAVIACDQYTSEPEYWKKVEELVGEAPSTLNIIYPEAYLGEAEPERRIESIRKAMTAYLEERKLEPREGFVYVERQTAGNVRKGLVLCIDLEHYDYHKGAKSLIRATEGTILERIPPRVKIREGADLELPHIMVLIDDPENLVIGPLTEGKASLETLYDLDLMMDSGNLKGFLVSDESLEKSVISAFEELANPEAFKKKYALGETMPVLLFAMGDGNHSLATAKALWENIKEKAEGDVMSSPARHALVEVVNLHDDALVFEPIHRVVFGISEGRSLLDEMKTYYAGRYRFQETTSAIEMKQAVDSQGAGSHRIGMIAPETLGVIEISNPDSNLPVGSLQLFLDTFMKEDGAQEIDYIHGEEPLLKQGSEPGNMGFYLPAMDKHELFKTVILDGALPRKTFSMGEAFEKRFYFEARAIGCILQDTVSPEPRP